MLFLKIFEAFFNFLAKRTPYTFALALSTSVYGTVVAITTAIFLITTVYHTIDASKEFIFLFGLLSAVLYAPLHFIHFGMLNRLGVKCFSKKLNTVNKYIKTNVFFSPQNESDSRALLAALESVPKENMLAALYYSILILIILEVHQFFAGTTFSMTMIGIGVASAIFLYAFTTYIVSELLTGAMRRKIKKFLFRKKYKYKEGYSFSLKKKFTFIIIMVATAMIELGLMFYFGSSKSLPVFPIIFSFATISMIGSCLFFYFVSIENSLLDLEYASLNLAGGGEGKLFHSGLDKEIISTGKGFVLAALEVRDIRTNLEKKVGNRTKKYHETMGKLTKTLNEINSLKEQQDGDYFLTSLLIEPLSQNMTDCKNISIGFFIRQKKRFRFRRWEKEIGGDICVAYNLQLKGKKYAAFLNADAMGKSMQGASGALVIGSGFKAIVDRNRFSSFDQDQYPESWLVNSLRELQSVFVSFDGSMLISLVMGLVDDETGLIYFVNAEHPWTVLYRDNQASFIEDELLLRKLGVEHEIESIKIKTFQMKPGDIIIAGSDGRDDISLAKEGIERDAASDRNINENENLFLSHVENGKGELENIASEIESFGELTDDISLLKITFNKDPDNTESEPLETLTNAQGLLKNGDLDGALREMENGISKYPKNSKILKEYVKLLVKNKKDYKGALEAAARYIVLNPWDTEMIYVSSICWQKSKNFEKAMQYAERIYQREPENVKYLLLLARTYIQIENYIEADKMLDNVLKIDPENAKAIKLKNSL